MGDAPPGHRKLGVEKSRLIKGTDGTIEIEGEHQVVSLIKPAARLLGIGHHIPAELSQRIKDHRWSRKIFGKFGFPWAGNWAQKSQNEDGPNHGVSFQG